MVQRTYQLYQSKHMALHDEEGRIVSYYRLIELPSSFLRPCQSINDFCRVMLLSLQIFEASGGQDHLIFLLWQLFQIVGHVSRGIRFPYEEDGIAYYYCLFEQPCSGPYRSNTMSFLYAFEASDTLDTTIYTTLIALFMYRCAEKYFPCSSNSVCFVIIIVGGILGIMVILLSIKILSSNRETRLDTNESVMAAITTLVDMNQLLINRTILYKAIQMNKLAIRKQKPILLQFKETSDDAIIRKLSNLGVGSGSTNVVVYGNSLALAAFYYIAQAFSPSRIHRIVLLSAPGCLPMYDTESFHRWPNCSLFANEALRIISEFKPDVVFLNFKFHQPLDSPIKNISDDIVVYKLQKTINDIMKHTKRIVFTYPHPHLRVIVGPQIIYDRLIRKVPITDLNMPFTHFLKYSANAYRRVNALICKKCDYVFSYRFFCYDNICYSYDPKTYVIYYQDGAHLGLHGIEFLTPYYREIADELYAKAYI
ncbi:unnamed protein product [Dracunculus medinensis]|uniref:SGNH domain-containing protein n=1 Tax=Dracunculus medinensis TaxID=318479 RepID=A0A0N4URK3_DRAME|nr:unnamed protein product [Dracunculus medinensis]